MALARVVFLTGLKDEFKNRKMENLVSEVMQFYSQGNYREILKLNEKSDSLSARKLLWVWPSEGNLVFIKRVLMKFGVRGIVSVGCGCGLLEWILGQHTGLEVIGYEVNEEWWRSKYSNPQFIELKYPEGCLRDISEDFALLFCYFNNGEAFRGYLGRFRGRVVIIVGPGRGAGRHTDPGPFNPDFGGSGSDWELAEFQEVKDTKDFIAVYVRSEINCVGV